MLDVILVVILYHRYLTTKKQMDTNSAFKKSMKLFFKIFLLPPLIYLLTHFIPSIKSPILPMAYKNNFSYLTKAERIGLGVLSNGFNLFYPVWIPYYYGITYYRYNFKKDEFKINESIKRTKNLCKKEKDCLPYLRHLLSKKEEGKEEYKSLLKKLYLSSGVKGKCYYYPSLYSLKNLFEDDSEMQMHAHNDAFILYKESCDHSFFIAYMISFKKNDIKMMERVLEDAFHQNKTIDIVQIGDHFTSEFYKRRKILKKSYFLNGEYRKIFLLFSKNCKKKDLNSKAAKSACRYIDEILNKEQKQ